MYEIVIDILEALDIFAFIGIIASIASATRRKSYEILITHRLKSLDCIREDLAQLLYWFSVEGVRDYKKQDDNIDTYNADVKALIYTLRMRVKPLYKQEIALCERVERTWENAQNYFAEPTGANEKTLVEENKKLQDKCDLYDWTLWLYIQQLHKDPKNKTELFDKLYNRVKKQKENAKDEAAKEAVEEAAKEVCCSPHT